jgi:hypothetical protein
MFQRAMLPIQSGVTAFCSLALVLNWNLLGQVRQPVLTRMALGHISNLKKVRQTTTTICSWLLHPAKSLSRLYCRGQARHKSSMTSENAEISTNRHLHDK